MSWLLRYFLIEVQNGQINRNKPSTTLDILVHTLFTNRRSKAVYSYVSNRDIVVEMEAPSRTETPGSGQVHVVEAQIEEVVDLVDMEADGESNMPCLE